MLLKISWFGVFVNSVLQIPSKEKIQGAKSGEYGGHLKSSCRQIKRLEKVLL